MNCRELVLKNVLKYVVLSVLKFYFLQACIGNNMLTAIHNSQTMVTLKHGLFNIQTHTHIHIHCVNDLGVTVD